MEEVMKFGITQDDELIGEVEADSREAAMQIVLEQSTDFASVEQLEEAGVDAIEIVVSTAKPMMMPSKAGTCIQCATDHPDNYPHNFQSITYQMRFRLKHDRDATHADTIAHLEEPLRSAWKEQLQKHPKITWSDPPEGVEPIAEKYVVSTGGRG